MMHRLFAALPWWGWALIAAVVLGVIVWAALRWIVKGEYTH